MVNVNKSSKKIILDLLRDSSMPVSGQQISGILNISRVAVWKQIKSLQELGYKIEGTSTGYKLGEDLNEDHLYSWEFETARSNYHTYRELNSTMDTAREKAVKGCPGFTTVIAERQNNGRGRGGKKWESDEGGLYFTSVIRPRLPSPYNYIYTLAATAAICDVFKDLYQIEAQTKWPNDVQINGKKISGILTEIHMNGDVMNWLNLGVGINVNNTLQLAGSSSLKEVIGNRQDRRKLLTAFERGFRSILDQNTPREIRNYWKQYCALMNQNILLKTAGGRVVQGKVENIDESGALLIRNKRNELEQALFGDFYIKE